MSQCLVFQAYFTQSLHGILFQPAGREFQEPYAQHDVFQCGSARQKLEFLENRPDFGPKAAKILWIAFVDRISHYTDRAGCGALHAHQQFQKACFARSAWACHIYRLAGSNLQADILKCDRTVRVL
jgi:hypothetical protein